MSLEAQSCAHNYHSSPAAPTEGERVFVWDKLPTGDVLAEPEAEQARLESC